MVPKHDRWQSSQDSITIEYQLQWRDTLDFVFVAKNIHSRMGKEMRFNLCRSCLAGPRKGKAEQLSKSRKKFHPTMYKD